MPQEHIYRQFDTELETVRARVLQMGGLVEKQIADAIEAMSNGDLELMNKVEEEDRRVNAFDVSIDEMCQHIIALRQPAATDLRMVMTVIKTTTDLERIGDEAKKIARMSKMIYEGERINMPRFREIGTWQRWCWTCCTRRWMRLPASIWLRQHKWCALTCMWTRNTA